MRLKPLVAALAVVFASPIAALALVAPPEGATLPDFDSRDGARRAAPAAAVAAEQLVSERLGVAVRIVPGELRDVPKSLAPADPAALIGSPSTDDPVAIARRFLAALPEVYRLSAAEVDALVVDRSFETRHSGWRHVWLRQEVAGIQVFGARIGVHLAADGRVMRVNAGPFVAGLAGPATPGLPAAQAVLIAADHAGQSYLAGDDLELIEETPVRSVFTPAHFRSQIPVELVWFPTGDGARLAWHVTLDLASYPAMYEVIVDAASGELLLRYNLTRYAQTAQAYPVHPEQTPAVQVYDLRASANPNSPLGWVTAGSFVTVGNNVIARNDPGPPTNPNCGPPLPQGPTFLDVTPSPTQDFIYGHDLGQEPPTYLDFATTNLFVINNWFHDHLYGLGFDEPAGNFQTDNLGRGGAGNDPVDAQAQDKFSCGTANNANFGTPADGSSGRMQMYLWTGGTPDRDGDLDADIIIHEYCHGLSNRLVGGPLCVGACALGSPQSGGMGESWGDQMAASITDQDATGEYSTLSPTGVRNYAFGSSPLTYADLGQVAGPFTCQVHADGEVWSAMLWEIRSNFIAFYGKAVGVPKYERYILDSMKLMAFPPSFQDAKAGMLQAAGTNQDDRCLIEFGFATRGMGFGSSANGNACPTAASPVVESFVPDPSCSCVAPAAPASASAVASAPNEVTISWAASPGAVAYYVERASDTDCASATAFTEVARVEAPATGFVDTSGVQGGYRYAYRVVAEGQWGTFCLSSPVCSDVVATGNCTLDPTFTGLAGVTTPDGCSFDFSWPAATSACPLATTITYNVFRSTALPVDTAAPPRARVTATSYSDSGLTPGTTYYYLVRAEDSTTGNDGPMGGNVDDFLSYVGVVAGERTGLVASYDFEAATNEGWTGSTTGCAAGTATGAWERADPIGTVQFGQAVPEDCRGGTLCWITQNCGAPGCGVGSADVDASSQYLLTPAFDCSGGPRCFVSYWLWYYYSVSVAGARMMVEVSSDDGASWLPLLDAESARAAGARVARWNRYEHDLSQVPGLGLTTTMRLRFLAEDCVATIVEALVDDFRVELGQDCQACSPGAPGVLANRLWAGPTAAGSFWLWSSYDPTGSWNLHATPDPTQIAGLWSNPASVVGTSSAKSLGDDGSFPLGFYQVYGADRCTGASVP